MEYHGFVVLHYFYCMTKRPKRMHRVSDLKMDDIFKIRSERYDQNAGFLFLK